MPQSFSCLHTHIVFSTKHRQRFLTPDLTERLYPYLGGLARNRKCSLVRIGGVEDHIHLLVQLARDVAVSEFVGAIKSVSSGWIHDEFPDQQTFAWQQGHAAFAVSLSGVEFVTDYIAQQAEHHRKKSFQEELLEYLPVHGIESDDRYMWDRSVERSFGAKEVYYDSRPFRAWLKSGAPSERRKCWTIFER